MTAGSKPSFLASRGREQPTIFATMTVASNVIETTAFAAMETPLPKMRLSTSNILTKLQAERTIPHARATRISFQTILRTSRSSISPVAIPLMTVTDACPPLFPPVSMSIGMNAMRTGIAASFSSKLEIICPVNVAESIRSSSHGILVFQISSTLDRI